MTKFFTIPFADKGDKKEVPLDDSAGFVSYTKGYTPDYEKDPTKDKGKPIERDKLNGIFYDITANIKQWQESTFPIWGAKNLDGSNFGYPKDAVVRVNNVAYKSLADNNSEEPTASNKWEEFSGSSIDAPVGTISEYIGASAPFGWAICNGASFDKSVYKELFTLLQSDKLPNLTGMVLKGLKPTGTILSYEPQQVGQHTHPATVEKDGAHKHKIGSIRLLGKITQIGVYGTPTASGVFSFTNTGAKQMQTGGDLTMVNYDLNYDVSKGWTGEMQSTGEHTHNITVTPLKSKDNLVDNVAINFIIKLG